MKPGLFSFLGVVFLFMVGGFLFLRSPYFSIREVTVDGCVSLSRDEVLELAGIREGMNIFAVNLDKTQKLLECSPLIKTADVKRELPSTIYIRIEERKPVALVVSGGKLWLVDLEGKVLGEDNGKIPGLVAIVGVSRSVSTGSRLEGKELQALACLRAMGPLTSRVTSEIQLQGDELVLLLKEGGALVYLGEADAGLKGRLESLESVLSALAPQDLSRVVYIELRYGKPSVRFRDQIVR